ncbi:hypothetical protein BGW80DRAFT_588112 [Lactifluus volemus]|nr:hypothetical protein BGW80DRAFT_588112 [Lactifluus volemus]
MPKLTTGPRCGTAPLPRTERSPHARTRRTRQSLQLERPGSSRLATASDRISRAKIPG